MVACNKQQVSGVCTQTHLVGCDVGSILGQIMKPDLMWRIEADITLHLSFPRGWMLDVFLGSEPTMRER